MNYYRRYIGDYLAKTGALTLAEHGAYTVLLDVVYSTEKPLPASLEALYRLCRAMNRIEQEAVKSVAEQFFPVGVDGLRHNLRADEEIAKAQSTIAKQRESGAEAARKRWSASGCDDGSGGGLANGLTHKLTDGSAIQPPTTNLQPLEANHQPPTFTQGKTVATRASRRAAPAETGSRTTATWAAFKAAYAMRYGVEPTQNATTNAQMANFVARVPVAEAPEIAAFYVGHNGAFYVRQKHPVGALCKDAEGLRTEWLSGRVVTDTEARQADRTQATGNVFAPLIAEAREREAKERALD